MEYFTAEEAMVKVVINGNKLEEGVTPPPTSL